MSASFFESDDAENPYAEQLVLLFHRGKMMFSRKDEIRFDTQPVFNYLDGDSIYLCNPIKYDGGYSCLHLASYNDVISTLSPTHAIVMGVFMLYHYILYRTLIAIIRN